MALKLKYLTILLSFLSLSVKSQTPEKEAVFGKYRAVEVSQAPAGEKLLLVTLNRPLTVVETQAIKPLRSLSADHIVITEKQAQLLSGRIISGTQVNALWKASDQLAALWEQSKNKKTRIRIVFDQQHLLMPDLIRSLTNYTIDYNNSLVTADIQLNDLMAILQQEAVLFADVITTAKEEIVINDNDLPADNITAIRQLYPQINGNSITVSLKEGLFDKNDIDIAGNITALPAKLPDLNSHATIMATLILGRGNTFIRGLGVAPAAKLTSSDFSNLMPDDIGQLKDLNVRVQNHSYGTGIDNVYGIEAVAYDKQVFEADTMVHVFSAGNIGTTPPTTGIYAGIANTANLTGDFKQAKNVLVVGGINRENIPEPLSSRGPAYDGRVKPEIVALGEDGTSGSAALATGVVTLMQQQYRILFNKQPPASLVKSILTNSAADLGAPHVDYVTGFGRLNALGALQTIVENRFKTGTVTEGEDFTFPLQVQGDQQEVKVTLAWTDPPAVINSTQGIVNHLDLSMETPSGAVILPWVLSSYPNADSLAMPALRKTDHLNTVQQLSLENVPAGSYTVHVKARRVTQGKQDFSIAYQFKPADQFSWTYPQKDDAVFAAEDNYLRWESNLKAQTGKLSVSYDNGTSWEAINGSTDPGSGFFKWTVPQLFTRAILKMEISGKEFRSGSFIISKAPALEIGYNCTDKLLFHWKPQPGATGYTLYNLKDNVLTALSQVKDTLVIVDKSTTSSSYFAVAANGTDFSGLKSYTIDYTVQAIACYVRSLLGSADGDAVQLDLSIGSTYNLKNMTWEKQAQNGTFIPLAKNDVIASQLSYSLRDNNPVVGIQYYRVTFETSTGEQIRSDVLPVNFLRETDFVFYPNPVTTNLSVLSGDFTPYTLSLYSLSGQRVFNENGTGTTQFNISALSSGLYIGVISRNGNSLKNIKVIKK